MPIENHPFVKRLSSFTQIGRADLKALDDVIAAERLVKKQRELVVDGEEYRQLCFVKDGYAMRYKLLRNGKRQILNIVIPGDVIGFPVSFFDRSAYSVVATSDLKLNICLIDSYAKLCFERPQFGLALSWLAAQEAAIYAERLVGVGRRTPVERLVHFLLELHSRLMAVGIATKTGFNLPMSQETMADALGLSVPHLNRVMQQLRKENLISTDGRLIELSDIGELQTLAHYQPMTLAQIPQPRSCGESD